MLRVESFARLRRLEIEAQPLLDADGFERWRALGKVEEQHQVERDGSGKDRVAAEEINLDLHRIAEPSENVDVVPAFLVIAAGRVIVDANLVEDILVEVGGQTRLVDGVGRTDV